LIMSRAAVDGFLDGTRLTTDSPSAARALVVDDVRQELGDVRCPTLVLWGARDNQLPLADAFDYARRLGAELRVIADCGHLLIGERPDLCAEAIESFLG
jgi:pimeloyl-ACP methyl ester carboxylesterase